MNNNLKALLEKRNNFVGELEDIVKKAEVETRSFEDAELSRVNEINKEVVALDETINKIKETRSLAQAQNKGDNKLDNTEKQLNNVDLKAKEIRGVEQYLRGQNGEERRALEEATTVTKQNAADNTPGNGGVTVPETLYTEIIELLEEQSPVFAAVRKFGSVTGNLKIARETELHDEGFIGETLDATKIRPSLKTVTLTQKRVGAAMQLTNQLVLDSGVDIVGYANSVLARSVARAIERGILLGAKEGEEADQTFRPIIGDPGVQNFELAEAGAPTIEELMGIYTALNPAYLDGAMIIVSREVFNQMVKYKDGDGTYLVFRDIVDGKPGYTIFGVPVYVTSLLKDQDVQFLFGNFQEAYGMLVKQDMNYTVVTADTTQALAGGRLTVLDAYMDGAVINPNAIVTASVPTP